VKALKQAVVDTYLEQVEEYNELYNPTNEVWIRSD
jgi:hypothetical protein